jgi:acyl-CoA thioester hydrolase
VTRDRFRHWNTILTRFRDLDPMGHVNSSVYFTYFEVGRTDYFEKSGVSARRVRGKWGIPVVSQTCNYRQQVFHPSTLDVGVRCAELREKTVHLEYAIFLAGTGTLVAEGGSISVWADLELAKSVPLPDDVRGALMAFETGVV